MKRASISETKNHLSALLREVRNGETVVVMDRKRPVARIESIASAEGSESCDRVERLQRAGVLLASRGGRVGAVLAKQPPRPAASHGAVEALLEERESGR